MGYTMNPQYQKSVLDAYSTMAQTVATGNYIDYDNISVLTGCSIKYVAGTPGIVINTPGLYLITIDGTVAASGSDSSSSSGNTEAAAASASSTETTDITVALQDNGVLVPGAQTSVTSTGEDDKANISLTTVLKVRPSCCAIDNTARLSVVNTGIPATFTDASITIVKMC